MEQLISFASNNGMLSAIWVALVVMIIVTTIKMQLSPIKQITTQDLTFLMNREEAIALDIRKEKDFKAGHILDAKNLPNEKISKNGLASLEQYKDKPIIVVCYAGMTAVQVANSLLKDGFTRVSVLKGGMNSWTGASLPVAK
jgi:rhodanese-related sulfurtransferase